MLLICLSCQSFIIQYNPALIQVTVCPVIEITALETWWTICSSDLMLMWVWRAGITPPAQHHTIRSGPHCSTYQRKPHLSLTQRASPAPAPPRPRPDGTMESPSPVWAKPASWVSTQWGFWLHRWHIQQNTSSVFDHLHLFHLSGNHCMTGMHDYESCYGEGNPQTSHRPASSMNKS